MAEYTIDLTKVNFPNDRAGLRNKIIGIFLEEIPGTGKGEFTARYTYNVKELSSGEMVYLRRPAQFNNGFDFTINVTGIDFNSRAKVTGKKTRSTTRPTHSNIIDDLKDKKNESLAEYRKLKQQIDRIYNCQEPTEWNFNFNSGYPSDLILACIKWLFVEQDVTYWNYSGRAMFYNGINSI